MIEYISEEDISRVLLERTGANKSCLIRARELGIHETEQYFNNLLFEDGQITSLIEELPSVDARPNIHGHWKALSDGYGDNAYICECSECKDTVWVYKDADRKWNFCPNCGADMRDPKDILHKAIDNTTFAEEIYPNIKEELHKAVDMADK